MQWIPTTRSVRRKVRRSRLIGGLRLWGLMTCSGGLVASAIPSSLAFAASPASRELEYQAEIEQITAEFAVRNARERKLLSAEIQARYDELEAKNRELQRAEAKATTSAAKLAKIRRERSRIAKQFKAVVDELAARDRQIAAQAAAFREAATKIATSPNPKKRAALKRYAAGDRKGALRELDEIVEAENAAIEIASNMKRAANLRLRVSA